MSGAALGCWSLLVAAGLVYGSLLPFDFRLPDCSAGVVEGFLFNRPPSGMEDIFTNVAVYIPLGFVLSLWRGVRGGSRAGAFLLSVAVGSCLSVGLEIAQAATASRVSSVMDVELNVLGSAVGAAAAHLSTKGEGIGGAWARAYFHRYRERPCRVASGLLLLGVVCLCLGPFDVVTSTQSLHASLGRSRIDLTVARGVADSPWVLQPLFSLLTTGLSFAALAYAFGLAAREAGEGASRAFAGSCGKGIALTLVLECLQILTRSHVFDAAALLFHGLCVAAGAWLAVVVVDRQTRSLWRVRHDLTVPTPILAAGLLIFVAAWIGERAAADTLAGMARGSFETWRLPFAALWSGSMHLAAWQIIGHLAGYGVLASLLAVWMGRLQIRRTWLGAGSATLAVALVRSLAELVMIGQGFDPTEPILALVGICLALQILCGIRRMSIVDPPAAWS